MEVLDRRILAFVGAHRFALPAQVSEFLEVNHDVTAASLSALTDGGLLRYERLLPGRSGLVRVTASGLRAIGSRLPAPGVELRGVRRELAVVAVWIRAWQGMFGQVERILSRREMVGLDVAATEVGGSDNGFALPAGAFCASRRYPDLMLAFGEERVPVEVRLWPDRIADVESLLTGYLALRNVTAVCFCVDGQDIADEIKVLSERLGIADRVWARWVSMGVDPRTG